ncbi:hypothetical protein CFOL_v3_30889 [Cephalotus follicularis]|uniref:Thionin-like protein 2 n=1 Tax=Cephalotus follicularis TaxID=3775 RepID=A0A1Q3D575_CEPFO|nr:hypothetical protein CFOL_v3_30889 [Cephalotus follicularis]
MVKTRANSLLVVCLLFGLLVQQSTALFCYTKCMCQCIFFALFVTCPVMCLFKCQSNRPPMTSSEFCEIGCSLSSCAHLNNKDDPGKVKGCLDSCSNTCVATRT